MLNNKVLGLIVALHAEAQPFIRKLGLQRTNDSRPSIYESDKICLIVSGVGRKNAAVATAALLEKENPRALCNVGICGSRNKGLAVGSTIYVNRIRDSLTEKMFYPDPLPYHELPEAGLVTHDEPQTQSSLNRWPDLALVDMEAAAICKEIEHRVPPHRWHFLKIVSDHLEGNRLKGNKVENLVERSCSPVCALMENIRLIVESEVKFGVISASKLDVVSQNLCLTVTQKRHLKRLCLHKISMGDLNLDVLNGFKNSVCTGKLERNEKFKEICYVLLS